MKYRLYRKAKSNTYFFQFLDSDGSILLQSQPYDTADMRNHGLKSVIAHAGDISNYKSREKSDATVVYSLYANNGEEIARSPSLNEVDAFKSMQKCIDQIPALGDEHKSKEENTANNTIEESSGNEYATDGVFDDYKPLAFFESAIDIKEDGFYKFFKDSEYYFTVVNDKKIQIISEGYKSEKARDNGVQSVQTNLVKPDRYKRLLNKAGHYYYNLQAANGAEIGTSRWFNSHDEMDASILSLLASAGSFHSFENKTDVDEELSGTLFNDISPPPPSSSLMDEAESTADLSDQEALLESIETNADEDIEPISSTDSDHAEVYDPENDITSDTLSSTEDLGEIIDIHDQASPEEYTDSDPLEFDDETIDELDAESTALEDAEQLLDEQEEMPYQAVSELSEELEEIVEDSDSRNSDDEAIVAGLDSSRNVDGDKYSKPNKWWPWLLLLLVLLLLFYLFRTCSADKSELAQNNIPAKLDPIEKQVQEVPEDAKTISQDTKSETEPTNNEVLKPIENNAKPAPDPLDNQAVSAPLNTAETSLTGDGAIDALINCLRDPNCEAPQAVNWTGTNFAYNESSISDKAKADLDKLVALLKQNTELKINIKGHVAPNEDDEFLGKYWDERGTLTLSQLRARLVHAYLTAKGISGNRLTYEGMGTAEPISTDNIGPGWKLNKRVEFELVR